MDDKIGCFGSVLYHDVASKRCTACPLLATCAQEVASNKTKLEAWFEGLRAQAKTSRSSKQVGKRGIKPIAAPDVDPIVAASVTTTKPLLNSGKQLMKKPKLFVDAWCKKGIKFESYKEGVNPFTLCGNKFAVVAMAQFMEHKTVVKSDLNDVFQKELGWLAGTAASHVNIVFDAFEYLGIITTHGPTGYLRQ